MEIHPANKIGIGLSMGEAAMPGIGGAPTRCTTFPKDDAGRKATPVASGFMDYFPDAIAAVAQLSYAANQKHNPGQPLHWARGKSSDEADTLMRHFLQRGTVDDDGILHDVKVAWRAMAMLQKTLEERQRRFEACRTEELRGIATKPGACIDVRPDRKGLLY